MTDHKMGAVVEMSLPAVLQLDGTNKGRVTFLGVVKKQTQSESLVVPIAAHAARFGRRGYWMRTASPFITATKTN